MKQIEHIGCIIIIFLGFLAAGGNVFLFPTEKDSKTEKRSWIEATVVSSSSDDELYMSISEEYEYTDMDEGVVLIERRYLKNDIK